MAGINGLGDAEMADRGSDIGEERGSHNEDGCATDTVTFVYGISPG